MIREGRIPSSTKPVQAQFFTPRTDNRSHLCSRLETPPENEKFPPPKNTMASSPNSKTNGENILEDVCPPPQPSLIHRALRGGLATCLTYLIAPPLLDNFSFSLQQGLLALGVNILIAGVCMGVVFVGMSGRESVTAGEVAFMGPQLLGPWLLWVWRGM